MTVIIAKCLQMPTEVIKPQVSTGIGSVYRMKDKADCIVE